VIEIPKHEAWVGTVNMTHEIGGRVSYICPAYSVRFVQRAALSFTDPILTFIYARDAFHERVPSPTHKCLSVLIRVIERNPAEYSYTHRYSTGQRSHLCAVFTKTLYVMVPVQP